MNENGTDPITIALGGLAVAAPEGLRERVFASWLRAPSRLGEVYIAFTATGVQLVRPSDQGDAEVFAQAYRDRFGRPLHRVDRAPAGVLPALRGAAASPPLDLGASSAFEQAVLAATRRIPVGQTRPYAWVAREAGHPRAVRAVGTVLAGNPVPLLVPCHRVVRSDGALGGYMFGPARKEALLRAEDCNLDEVAELAARGVHFLGSATTGIVCFPTCRDARRITRVHRRDFRTLAAAATAGFRPCRRCRPAVDIPA